MVEPRLEEKSKVDHNRRYNRLGCAGAAPIFLGIPRSRNIIWRQSAQFNYSDAYGRTERQRAIHKHTLHIGKNIKVSRNEKRWPELFHIPILCCDVRCFGAHTPDTVPSNTIHYNIIYISFYYFGVRAHALLISLCSHLSPKRESKKCVYEYKRATHKRSVECTLFTI